MKKLLWLFVIGVYSGNCDSVDIDRIKLGENDPVWEMVQTASSRAFTTPSITTTNLNNPLENGEFPSQNSLKDFLENYVEKIRKDKIGNGINLENGFEIENDNKDQKSWNILEFENKRHQTDDRKGWVTLDPVPWSVSKVSKWKPKPTQASWDSFPNNQYQNPWSNEFIETKPHVSQYQYNRKPEQDSFKVFYISDKNPVVKQPFARPFTVYDQSIKNGYHKTPIQISNMYKPQESFTQHRDGIIIDNNPPNFPTENYDFNRRSGHDEKPEPHAFLGDGEWILLSTTKGYKTPRSGQRSLDFHPQSMSTTKSVQLTVLPPLKNSKINMTTSHGGLLQVESTFESVEQAQRKYQKQQKNKIKKRKRPNGQIKKKKKVIKEITDSTITTVPRSTDSSAVLAAVGAGMIPATMAMLVPMVNGRKRRRKRELLTTSDPRSSIEITLPRYY